MKLNQTSFPYKLSHYEFTIDGKVYTFQPYQILHIQYPDPNDDFVGIGILQTIPTWIDSENYAMEYNHQRRERRHVHFDRNQRRGQHRPHPKGFDYPEFAFALDVLCRRGS